MAGSIWDAFYRSYANKQASETQKEQFAQEMAVRQAAQRLNESQFKFQTDTQFPAEQENVRLAREQQNTQFGLSLEEEKARRLQSGALGWAGIGLQNRYATVAENADKRAAGLFGLQMEGLRYNIEGQREIRANAAGFATDNGFEAQERYSRLKTPEGLAFFRPTVEQKMRSQIQSTSKMGPVGQQYVFGVKAGDELRNLPWWARALGKAQTQIPLFGSTIYGYQEKQAETSPEATRLRNILKRDFGYGQTGNLPATPEDIDALITETLQMLRAQQQGAEK